MYARERKIIHCQRGGEPKFLKIIVLIQNFILKIELYFVSQICTVDEHGEGRMHMKSLAHIRKGNWFEERK